MCHKPKNGIRMNEMKTSISLHLLEMRYRILYIFLSFCITFFVGATYSVSLTHLLCISFSPGTEQGSFFIFTHVTEGFYAAVEISLMCAFSCCIPQWIYQAHSFFIPSCYQGERKGINLILFFMAVLCITSFYLTYLFILPKICTFLRQFQYESKCMEIKLEARIAPAVHWSCTTLFFTAVFFQTPILLTFLYKGGFLTPSFLYKNRKYAFFSILVLASLVSPPDVSTQCILATTGCLFYESFFWCILFFHGWKK